MIFYKKILKKNGIKVSIKNLIWGVSGIGFCVKLAFVAGFLQVKVKCVKEMTVVKLNILSDCHWSTNK